MPKLTALIASGALVLPTAILAATADAGETTAGSSSAGQNTGNQGSLTVCFVGLGRHGKVQSGSSEENLETGIGIGIGNSGYYHPSGCFTNTFDARTAIRFAHQPKAPYVLRSVASVQTDGSDARVTVTRGQRVSVILDTDDSVTVTLSYARRR